MDLSNDLISQFVKITNDDKKKNIESTVYGTVVEHNGGMYVKIDGSDLLTPVETTADFKPDERVTVMIKNHSATVTGNITSPAANEGTVTEKVTEAVEDVEGKVITEVEILIADRVSTEQLDAEVARIDNLIAGKATIEDLEAIDAKIENLEVENLEAINAEIKNLKANKAEISDLKATTADIEVLDAKVASIDTLVNGNLTSDNILSFHVTADKVTMDDAFINDAMISNVSAGKITSGSINTSLVSVQSEDGALTINGSTQQFKDADGNVRIQIGKDATGDFTFALYGEDGQGQLINQNGITASAIEDGLIVDKMVADNAAISGEKLDISSVITEINNDNSTTIKSNKIYLDEQNQSLEVAFKSLKYDLNNLSIGGNNLIRNSTFLEGAKAWGMVGNASVDSTSTPYPSVLINESGNTSNTWAGAASYGQGATKIDMHYGDVYVMSCYVYVRDTSSLDNGLGLSIKGKNASGSDVEIQGVILTASELTPQRWTRITKVVYLQNEYTDCYIYGYVRRNGLAWFSRFQLEKGNTVTEWRLSDADLEAEINSVTEKVTSNTTEINVCKGNINTLVAEDEIIKKKVTDLNNTVAETEETLTSKYSALEQDVSGFKSSVASTYATKKSVDDLSTNLSTKYSTTETMNSAISQSANNIKTEVSTSYTTKSEFNGLEIGGTNLVRNSTFKLGDAYWEIDSGCSVYTLSEPYPSLLSEQAGHTTNKWHGCRCFYLPEVNTSLKAGETYTLSGYYYVSNTNVPDYGIGLCVKGENSSGSYVEIAGVVVAEPVTVNWIRIYKTFTLTQNYTRCQVYAYVTRNGTAWFNRIQLEKGNKVTDWGLSSVDLQNQINDTNNNLSTNYSTTETMKSAIEQSAKDITSTVSKTYATQTSVSDLEKNLTTNYTTSVDMKSAIEQSANNIRSEVSTSYTTKSDFNNLSIGGNNLIRNSTFLDGSEAWAMVGGATVDSTSTPYPSVLVSKTGASSNTWAGAASYGQGATKIDMHYGDVYVMSCYVYVRDTSLLDEGVGLSIKGKNTSGSDVEIQGITLTASEVTPQKWVRLSKVVYLEASYTDCYIYGYVRRNGVAWFSRFQLEKGNKVTEWRLSNTDLEAEIKGVSTDLSVVEQTANKINWLVKSGTSSSNMTLTDTTYSLISNNINLTADRIDLHGYVTANNGFSIDGNGNMTAKNGQFSGNITGSTFSSTNDVFQVLSDGTVETSFLAVNNAISTNKINVNDIENAAYPKVMYEATTVYINPNGGVNAEEFYDGAQFTSISNMLAVAPRNLNGYTLSIRLMADVYENAAFTWFHSGQVNFEMQEHTLYGYFYGYGASMVYRLYGGTSSSSTGTWGHIKPNAGRNLGSYYYAVLFQYCQFAVNSIAVYPSASSGSSSGGIGAHRGATGNVFSARACGDLRYLVRAEYGARVHVNSTEGVANNATFCATTGGIITLNSSYNQAGRSTSGNPYWVGSGGLILCDQILGMDKITFNNTAQSGSSSSSGSTTRTVTETVKASSADTYRSTVYNNWKGDGTVRQGDYGYGDCQGCWFFGNNLYTTMNAGTVTKVVIRIQRQAGGVNAAQTLTVKSHNHTSRPSGAPTYTNTIGTCSCVVGSYVDLVITDSATINKLKACKGLGLSIGSTSSPYVVCSGSCSVIITYTTTS